ncbi:uncharacterized protein OCT59_003542 [Rhizophagus irregularis]|uniref:HTH myb-type domain-containing protein n=3 Tax=Rhizophagus irregularis TaxID=588596 RepID=A0A015ILX0_RHIIW|nr:hypothetical protein GLOIN_2v1844530 [Rhizophagus irregularis DAOM 181602=DAOM 197198]EXX55165.1 hypothetical protein RirG_227780 [Rhizophagus irregularis DAOM 197198w]POG65839.1 hypothetical protein GLOIN_2v1844530 [Rhizophagus irregularis DAOM 181602=DAOM 197198]UZO11991.1 hypothetical protein OCT59_003542 [Rhizophagus irregularis]GBC37528.2 hypothetical protein GLOIN_2v1844530 [Rhizophagus irregularis DAOM 181602=DAOM 197198]|eukprot:XP_025172705.1 hypothetical protein GLOIN_2v1844530 [Rhizophagus irregularis DAOM 181602=DAOM 197198]
MVEPKKKQQKKLQTKKIKTEKIELFDDEIISAMNEYKNEPNPYIKISKKINKGFTSKQIRQRWISQLDPRLCHNELDEDERSYINEWVKEYKNQNPSDKICWTKLILKMDKKFGKLRTENRVKNFWYLKKRQERRRRQLPSKVDASSSPQDNNILKSVSFCSQDNNIPKSVLFCFQDNNVPTTISPSPQDNNIPTVSPSP